MDPSPTTKTDTTSQRSSFSNQNNLNSQHSDIINEKAGLHDEIQRSDSAGLSLYIIHNVILWQHGREDC